MQDEDLKPLTEENDDKVVDNKKTKKKMDPIKKIKLIYSGELLIVSIVAFVIGFLQLFYVMPIHNLFTQIFRYLTLAGGIWIIVDFIWILASKKRRMKNCLLDKIINLPLGIYLIVIDLIMIIKGMNVANDYSFFQIFIPISLLYLGCDYLFQSIFHWFRPLQSLIDEELEKDKNKEENKDNSENSTPKE